MTVLTQLLRCQRGANAIEYAIIASLISIAAIAGMQALGTRVNSMYGNVSSNLD